MKKRLILTAICAVLLAGVMILCSVASLGAGPSWTDVKENAWYTKAVVRANELGIMKGTTDTTFAPMKSLTRAEYVTILGRLEKAEENLPYSFTDIPEKAWYKTYVGWAEQAGIVNGYNGDAKAFAGNKLISRAEMMVMTARYMKYKWISFEDASDIKDFTDKAKVDKIKWAAEGIETTRKAGLIKGDAKGNFNPNANASRAEIATIVVRFVDKLPEAKDPMFMKFEHLTELVECEGKNVVLTFGRWLDVRQNRPDVIGDQILPQMGLDTDVYELVMTEQNYKTFKLTYQENVYQGHVKDGECKKGIMTPFGIRNKLTGEETAQRMHLCNAYFKDVGVEASTYDVDLPDDVLKKMCETGVDSTGNLARLASVFKRAEAGEELNVVYIGGSICAGAGADPGGNWVSGVTDWFEKRFPKAKVTGVNAGVGGTGSDYGVMRLYKHVLNFEPDIVFIEFVSNDGAGENHRESYEALLRKFFEYGEDTAVIQVLVASIDRDNGLADVRRNHLEFAEHYDLPNIDIHRGVHAGVDTGLFDFGDFTHDGDHPTTWGHMVMSDIIEYFLDVVDEKIKKASVSDLEIKPLPEMITKDTYMNFGYIDEYHTENVVSMGDWEQIVDPDEDALCKYNVWTTSKIDGKPLTFKFTGKELYLVLYNSPCLELKISDGVNEYVVSSPEAAPSAAFSADEEKEYTVTVTMKQFYHNEKKGTDEPPYLFAITYK